MNTPFSLQFSSISIFSHLYCVRTLDTTIIKWRSEWDIKYCTHYLATFLLVVPAYLRKLIPTRTTLTYVNRSSSSDDQADAWKFHPLSSARHFLYVLAELTAVTTGFRYPMQFGRRGEQHKLHCILSSSHHRLLGLLSWMPAPQWATEVQFQL